MVRWGERQLLLSGDDFVELCNECNGARPQPFWSLLERQPVHAALGKPDVPAPFRRMLLDQPLAARVTAVSDAHTAREPDYSTHLVWLDVGIGRGAFCGMRFYFKEPRVEGELTLVDIDNDSAVAMWHTLRPNDSTAPEVGWLASTSAPSE
jgi:hypothetical protein